MIQIYDCNDMYLYEIIENYKESNLKEDKSEIFNSFCDYIWASDNKRRIYTKTINFNVKKDLLQTELGKVFDTWSSVEYKYYKSMTKDNNWRAILRQKVNNIYTRYFDKEVILGKEYMDLIKTPKKLYYEWISGIDMDAAVITEKIDDSIAESNRVKQKLQNQKMTLSWESYKVVIEEILLKCFENCKLIGDCEDKASISRLDFLTEDYLYVGYICRYLEKEILQYQKRYYGVRQHKRYKRCEMCGDIIEKTNNRVLYCKKCGIEVNRIKTKNSINKLRSNGV